MISNKTINNQKQLKTQNVHQKAHSFSTIAYIDLVKN